MSGDFEAPTFAVTRQHMERAMTHMRNHRFRYCCNALTHAIREYNCHQHPEEAEQAAIEFLRPLLHRDNIRNDGTWKTREGYMVTIGRLAWMQKILNEMPEEPWPPSEFSL